MRPLHALCPLAAICLCLVLAPAAVAAKPFTWDGDSTTSEEWSVGANWENGKAPKAGESISTLTFPKWSAPAFVDT